MRHKGQQDEGLFGGWGAAQTLHRPSNVDNRETFEAIASALNQIASEIAILFPVHPWTGKMIAELGITFSNNIHLLRIWKALMDCAE
ncbi:MAG: UDP-N-acetylglucosamine 2-epimerase [Syntrophobacteraceae bacterium]